MTLQLMHIHRRSGWQCAELLGNEELDLEVLRIAVFREAWECLTDNDACSLQETVVPLSGCFPGTKSFLY